MNLLRLKETRNVKNIYLLKEGLRSTSNLFPNLMCLIVLVVHNKWRGDVNLEDSLQLIAYSNMMIVPTIRFVLALRFLAIASISCGRIEKLLKTREFRKIVKGNDVLGNLEVDGVSAGWKVNRVVYWQE
jgi:hypothetical protein